MFEKDFGKRAGYTRGDTGVYEQQLYQMGLELVRELGA
jgi:hypothetical protein